MVPSDRTAAVLGETNIHLDFHTPPFQRDIGEDLDPDRFAQRLEEANVDSIALFAKGCHGMAYYDTEAGVMHPNLDFDLLQAQIEACHERDIAVLGYYVLAWDNLPGEENPDWYQRDGDGEQLAAETREDRWEWLCLNSPYTEERVLPQVRELLEYDLDGFFFDILIYHEDACTCRYCRTDMLERGLDPTDPADRQRHRTRVCQNFAARTTDLIKSHDQNQVVVYNHKLAPGLTSSLADSMDYLLIESLPVGWGYMHTPMSVRYSRNFDKPVQGMTGAFHEVWGDFGTVKHESQLKYELAMSLAHHISVSVGDQLLPRGELESAKYDVIRNAFEFAKERALPDAEPVRDVAVITPGDTDPSGAESIDPREPTPRANSGVGAAKLLCETHQQFDILDEPLAQSLLEEAGFGTVILPSTGALESETVRAVRSFVEDGGGLIATNTSSVSADGEFALGDVLGIERRGRLPYSSGYIDLEDYTEGVPDVSCVSYDGFQSIALDGATSRAQVVAPTTERSETRRFSHHQAPPEREIDVPAITHNAYGEGAAVYIGTPLFDQYYESTYHGHRRLLENVLGDVRNGRSYAATAPANVEVNAMRTDEAIYLHFVNYCAGRPGAGLPQIGEVVPVSDVSVTVYDDVREVVPVTEVNIDTERLNDSVHLTLDSVDLHEIVKLM